MTDVIEFTINKTKDAIEANVHTITDLTTTSNLTQRAKMALLECLDMEAANLEQLDTVIQYLREYPTKKYLPQYADDLKTLMSTTMTNKETCLDGVSDASKGLHQLIIQDYEHGRKMCSNVLAMIKNMTDTDIGNKQKDEVIKGKMWPEWLSAGNRKLLSGKVSPRILIPNVTVGKGKFRTVMAAVDAAPNKSTSRYVIRITAGTYKEHVHIPRFKSNIMFIGDGIDKTIITGNNNVGNSKGTTTTKSATVG
ncbi:hypothetical protein M8C21_033706 [Ambrosia artemisiifolia]|uniref:Pectinesterase inhibitor domain-containing protein n=1 Tax=Ambrosia artemisiifolia TaxID=4212 RepID=A0AAD5GAQ5_AMBAR|nr:hypothetical protein M8C21_033706 [Ambrosia artemisiifolia]